MFLIPVEISYYLNTQNRFLKKVDLMESTKYVSCSVVVDNFDFSTELSLSENKIDKLYVAQTKL